MEARERAGAVEHTGNARIEALDFIRGIAVLGILAVNVAGFAGPPLATITPNIPSPASPVDGWTFAAVFVLFEGKMRALFTLLFGASMLLFIDRMDSAGHHGEGLQLRRLAWLAGFGLLHYFLFWWGDILFVYALAGMLALMLREVPARGLAGAALILFAGWHLGSGTAHFADVQREERVRTGVATPAEREAYARYLETTQARIAREVAQLHDGFATQAMRKLRETPFHPLQSAFYTIGETLPLVLLGMLLYRSGFFTGGWTRTALKQLALIGTFGGLAMTLAVLAWVMPRGFPVQAMTSAILYWLALPHVLMALGYAAALVLAARRLQPTAFGRRITAAGRMAFSNYIGTTMMMTALFCGWGLGLAGNFGHAGLVPFVLLGWALMLGWSAPFLARFRQGPLEWLWRSLTEMRMIAFRR